MTTPIQFNNEDKSNATRESITQTEPLALRTFTASQAVLAKSAGAYHWTPEGRRLYDYTSGVLVANLGHNPRRWMKSFAEYMNWTSDVITGEGEGDYFEALTLTAYNAITTVEAEASERLINNARASKGGDRVDTVMWAASGSEAVQKALWAALGRDENRDMMIATRYGFHGKKGLAEAVTGTEDSANRDPRVKFISFPMEECDDMTKYNDTPDLTKYQAELDALWNEFGNKLNCLITEPYLGGGGSYHPHPAYMQLLASWCQEHDILFIMDEVQANFGRTGCMYAFEKYGVEPDMICLGKGLGNGVPVAAVIGRGDVMASLGYGAASDTWSANPLASAAVLATLDEFESTNVLENTAMLSEMFFAGLEQLKETGIISKVRGEGMVFGIECAAIGGLSAEEVANKLVEVCYLGEEGSDGIHLLGPLAGKVIRIAPPMTMTKAEANDSLELLSRLTVHLQESLAVNV